MMNMKPAIFGTVTAVNGTILTVLGKEGFGSTTASTTYSVDAANAKVQKNNATSSVSAIAVNDSVLVVGTVSGTNVTATDIRDGIVMRGGPGMMGGKGGAHPGGMGRGGEASTSPITGNGQPVVAGTISSVSGSTITITTKSNVSYTIDATNAKIVAGQSTVAASSLTVGDTVLVQGTVNGNSVTASSVIEQGAKPGQASGQKAPAEGFFGGITSFFTHLFGF